MYWLMFHRMPLHLNHRLEVRTLPVTAADSGIHVYIRYRDGYMYKIFSNARITMEDFIAAQVNISHVV